MSTLLTLPLPLPFGSAGGIAEYRRRFSFTEVCVLYMIIEHFRNGDPAPVYERFRARGRLAPDGLRYVTSWVTEDLTRCYQVMECDDPALLDAWMAAWADLVDCEIHPVITSAEASARVPK